ncbi:MAG: dihydrodipicolinate synthase family protein, partial [Actinomycetota bacterium]
VKDSTGDIDGLTRLLREAPDGFEVYSGDDWATYSYVGLGAAGVVSVASHLVGERIAEMVGKIEAGDHASARKLHMDLKPIYDMLFFTSSPIPLKAALGMVGLPAGPLRPPLYAVTDDERAHVESVLRDAGLL